MNRVHRQGANLEVRYFPGGRGPKCANPGRVTMVNRVPDRSPYIGDHGDSVHPTEPNQPHRVSGSFGTERLTVSDRTLDDFHRVD
jgi:hypothetical protein